MLYAAKRAIAAAEQPSISNVQAGDNSATNAFMTTVREYFNKKALFSTLNAAETMSRYMNKGAGAELFRCVQDSVIIVSDITQDGDRRVIDPAIPARRERNLPIQE